MECLNKDCKITSLKERLLTCWLCEKHEHLKCLGFNGKHFDIITDRKYGLRWSCDNCRSLEVDFYRLFKESKIELAAMKKEFSVVTSKLENFEKMFIKFEYADGSPKRKKFSAIASGVNLISLNTPVVAPPRNAAESLPSESHLAPPALCSPLPIVSSQVSSLKEFSTIETPSSESVPIMPLGPLSPTVPSIVVNPISNVDASAPNSSAKTVIGPCQSGSSNELVVVAPRKSIFISRLHSNTTINNISNYLKSKVQNLGDNDCRIIKFNSSLPRDISSFKIIVPHDMFDTLLNRSFWPDGVLVKEFVFREKTNANKPVKIPSSVPVSKN